MSSATDLTQVTVDSHPNPWAEPLTKPIEQLNTYLCFMPDFAQGSNRAIQMHVRLTKPVANRLKVRSVHLAQSAVGRKVGWTITAGPTFKEEAGSEMTGSYYILREESLQKAKERLSRDVYAVHGAWDLSKANGLV
ncbi:hypothetical protein OIO90_000894 [Microbotryomycetes sp. JL221]|nr:hypothetical protein OIO90_000894 [Microbotryomycetes sp. JL221]